MVAHEAHHGGAHLRTRPEAGGLDGAHELHVVVELRPDAREAARLGARTGRETFRDFGLDKDDDRLGGVLGRNKRGPSRSVHADALHEFEEDARAGLVGEVRDEGGKAVAGTVLDEVERVAGANRETGRVAERLGEAVRQHGVLLDRRHGEAPAEHLLGQHAETGADFQHARARRERGGVHDGLEGVAVHEEILPQHLVRVEAVVDAPRLDLTGTRQVHHLSSGKG